MKIAFQVLGNDSWTGGVSYLKNLLHALRYSKKNNLTLALLNLDLKDKIPEGLQQEISEVINLPKFKKLTLLWTLHIIKKTMFKKSYSDEAYILKKHRVGIVFKPPITKKYTSISVLSFIPDFQHVHLPEMFSEKRKTLEIKCFSKLLNLQSELF